EPLAVEVPGDPRRVGERRVVAAPAEAGRARQRACAFWSDADLPALDPKQRATAESGGPQLREREAERQTVDGAEQVHHCSLAVDYADVGARTPDVERDELGLARELRQRRDSGEAAHRPGVERLD